MIPTGWQAKEDVSSPSLALWSPSELLLTETNAQSASKGEMSWESPGGPVVRTWHTPCGGWEEEAQVRSLVEELRSHKPCGAAKKKHTIKEKCKYEHPCLVPNCSFPFFSTEYNVPCGFVVCSLYYVNVTLLL